MKDGRLIDSDVGRLLRLRRQELGMSQEQLAMKIGCTFQQVQKYEKGTNRISASRMATIAAALHIAPAYFFREVPICLAELDNDAMILNREIVKLRPPLRAMMIDLVHRLADALDGCDAKEGPAQVVPCPPPRIPPTRQKGRA